MDGALWDLQGQIVESSDGLRASFVGLDQIAGLNERTHVATFFPEARGSLVLRETEVEPAVAWVQPAAGDHFGAGEEAEAFFTVCPGITEE